LSSGRVHSIRRCGRSVALFSKSAALGADVGVTEERIRSGAAFAALAADYQEADKLRIEGSPSLVLNQGRQKLYGNVGFRLIEANVQGLLRTPAGDDASWC
jgi:predicted DsbA family dithiol-disulfide isomerase